MLIRVAGIKYSRVLEKGVFNSTGECQNSFEAEFITQDVRMKITLVVFFIFGLQFKRTLSKRSKCPDTFERQCTRTYLFKRYVAVYVEERLRGLSGSQVFADERRGKSY